MKDIIYAVNKTLANNLPMYVIVDFVDMYTSKFLLLEMIQTNVGSGWIPIKPIIAIFCTYDLNEYVEHTCTQIPLNFSWGLIVSKAQGGKFKKMH